MNPMPTDPKIFHITHVDNLAGIVQAGGLFSDAERIARNVTCTNIAHLHIKQRRLTRPVTTRAGGRLGDYVPFNFCPRSVMLYAVHRGHGDYQGGQASILHLVSHVSTAVRLQRPWAFSDRHAELAHALHYDDLTYLEQVPWEAMARRYWSDMKEERQAEFLVHGWFPWGAVHEIGTANQEVQLRVLQTLNSAVHRPQVTIRPEWYY